MKKVLFVASVTGHIKAFHLPYLKWFKERGFQVDVAARQKTDLPPEYVLHDVSFERFPFKKNNILAYKQLKKIISENHYDIIHCHTPVASMITRLVARKARKKGTKVIYTAHGFHFFKGAPLINWLLYYPVEKLCAHFTDVLLTINQEDYARAQKKLKVKKVLYVPGVGVDFDKFSTPEVERNEKRASLGIPADATVLLSVGEVNKNKNHQVIIRAMHLLADETVHYLVVGRGNQTDLLKKLAESLELQDRVHFLGFRSDIPELCIASDIFCFPSKREGLGLASLEAMSFGLPILTSNVHGINDYSENGVTGYKYAPLDAAGFAEGMKKLIAEPQTRKKMGEHNRDAVKKYSISNVLPMMQALYETIQNQMQ